METAETIKAKVAKILDTATENIMLADFEVKDLPALQDPGVLQQILDALQYGKDHGKLDDLCSDLGAPTLDGKGRIVFFLGGALEQLMHDLGIDPKGGAK